MRVALVGTGLIGASVGLAAKKAGAEVVGFDPDEDALAGASEKGAIDEIKGKLKQTPTGVFVGSIIANGEAEIGFQQVSELSHFAGVDYVGPLPTDVQQFTMFSSGIIVGAKDADGAKTLVKFITAPAAASAFRKRGMEPG